MDYYNISLKPSVEKDLRRLPKAVVAQVMRRIEKLESEPLPQQAVKLSVAEHLYRVRVGDYRIVYEVNSKVRQVMIH